MACSEENRAYTELWARKVPLERTGEARKAIEACVTKHYDLTKEKCGEELQTMVDCITKNKREWTKCAAARSALEECAGKNVL